jgi:hypothetical protein
MSPEIAGDALFQVLCLSYVDDAAGGVSEEVTARVRREVGWIDHGSFGWWLNSLFVKGGVFLYRKILFFTRNFTD